jgi:hypothetical protein
VPVEEASRPLTAMTVAELRLARCLGLALHC